MIDVERRAQGLNDGRLDVTRGRVHLPGHLQALGNPLGQPGLVVIDKHDATGAASAELLLIEQKAGKRTAQGRGAAAPQVVLQDPRVEVAAGAVVVGVEPALFLR